MQRPREGAAGDTPSLLGTPATAEHEYRFSSGLSQRNRAENKKEQGRERSGAVKKRKEQAL